jgi:hypothetical protein
MKQVTYSGYTISVSALEEKDGRSWHPRAIVSWAGGRQTAHLEGPKSLRNKKEAKRQALALAKTWVNQRMGAAAVVRLREHVRWNSKSDLLCCFEMMVKSNFFGCSTGSAGLVPFRILST